MAGSRKWMKYVSDRNIEYAVNIDESNGEVCDFADLTLSDIEDNNVPTLPREIKMRTINVQSADGISRTLPVGSPVSGLLGSVASILLYTSGFSGAAGAAVDFFIRSVSSESTKRSRPIANDTGILDGDAS